jgi:four helix bundle protein
MSEIRSYRDLLVWQKAMDLTVHCYQAVEGLPPGERFGLASSIHRTAVAVPSSIANGHGIGITGQYVHHLAQAHGSLMMLETLFLAAERLTYLDPAVVAAILKETSEVGKMLNGLMRSLRNHPD